MSCLWIAGRFRPSWPTSPRSGTPLSVSCSTARPKTRHVVSNTRRSRYCAERGHRDTPGEDARNPRFDGAPGLALPPGGAVTHDRGVRRALLAGVHAAPAPPLGRAEGGLPVLRECVVWHHPSLSTPPRARPRVPRKSLSVPRL